MVDANAQATLTVNVQGESGLQRLAAVLARIKRESGASGSRPQAVSATQSARQAQSMGERIAERIGSVIGATLRAPFDALKASGRVLGGSLLSLSGTFGSLATGAGVVSAGIVAVGAAIAGLALPIINLVGGFKILREAFTWAEEAAQNQISVAGRARRFFPQALGEGVEAAEQTMRARMATATALFGNAADSMQDQLTRRMSEYRLGRGIRGDKEIFSRWGITQESVQRYEKLTGSRVDLTTWLRLFTLKREELQKQLNDSSKSPAEKSAIARQLAMLADDTTKIFGQKFSDMMGAMTDQDLGRLQANLEAAIPLGYVENATRKSAEFTISLESLKATFSAITLGIGGDVQPAITSFLTELNRKLLDTKEGGEGLGRMFRELASAMANKTWITLRELMDDIKPEHVSKWIAEVNKWQPHETAETVKNFVHSVIDFGKAVGHLISTITSLLPASWSGAEEAAPAPGGGGGGAAPAPEGGSAAPSAPAPAAAPAPSSPAPGAPAPAAATAPAPAPSVPSVPSAPAAPAPSMGAPAMPGLPQQQTNIQAMKAAAAGRAAVTADVRSGPSGDTLVMKSNLARQPSAGGGFGASFGAGGTGGGPAALGAIPGLGMASGLRVPSGLPSGIPSPWDTTGTSGLLAPVPGIAGFGFSGVTAMDGAAFGAAAAQSLRDGLDGASVGGPAPTSYGVAPRAAPKPTGGDTASES